MNINDIINSNDPEKLGTIEELTAIINEFMQPFLINAKNYDELNDAIDFMKKNIDFSNNIFCSKEKEYLFYLTKLEGKQRNKLLGIADIHYENKNVAKDWYREIAKYVHPDKNKNSDANIAFTILSEIYNTMTDGDYDEQ